MNTTQQRITIAEACGWILLREKPSGLYNPVGIDPHDGLTEHIPDYLNDLNAMHEAETLLDHTRLIEYCNRLAAPVSPTGIPCRSKSIRATAAQRAEALLRTIGKWEESL